MYRIEYENKTVEVSLPCYVKWDDKVGSFRTCDEGDAVAILVGGGENEEQVYCDISTKAVRHAGFPMATITRI